MSRRVLFAFALLLCSSLLFAKSKTKVPELVTNAKYVFVTAYNGDQFSNTVYPDDRQALTDVQDALRKWGYYKIAYKPEDADIIMQVRKARYASVRPGVQIHAGSQRPRPAVEAGTNADGATTPDDIVSIHDAKLGVDSPPLWLGRMRDGLNPPDPRLLKQFRADVESSVKKKP
jgi:hypothetical protein